MQSAPARPGRRTIRVSKAGTAPYDTGNTGGAGDRAGCCYNVTLWGAS
jgi:hypothetical protein